jgi:hypothetical protein
MYAISLTLIIQFTKGYHFAAHSPLLDTRLNNRDTIKICKSINV